MPDFDLKEWTHALWIEFIQHKMKLVLLFAILTIAIVIVGTQWPVKFASSGVLFADKQNIIQPLLGKKASVQGLGDEKISHAFIVTERLNAPTVVTRIVDEIHSKNPEYANFTKADFKGGISVKKISKTHVRIGFKATSRELAFLVPSIAMNMFVQDTSSKKREQSKQAFLFIDSQAKAYKQQLVDAEERLKNFKSENLEGSEKSVASRREKLKEKLEQLNQELLEALTQKEELQQQIEKESEYLSRKYRTAALQERLEDHEKQLDALRLSYQENHPDIIQIKSQIEGLRKKLSRARYSPITESGAGETENPIFQLLRSRLTDTEVDIRKINLRIRSTENLLENNFNSAKVVAEFQAQLSELQRDYKVTKNLYEDMLNRKEKARLSMTLDIEGQGVSYKILEPPVFPTEPAGLHFTHFFAAAPFIGLLSPLAILIIFIIVDPRIRFSSLAVDAIPENVPLLVSIPRFTNTNEQKRRKHQMFILGCIMALVLAIHVSIGALKYYGLLG